MKKIILTFLVVLFVIGTADAKYSQTCKVKYKKDYGWSDYYTVEVKFMSGTELNRATNSFNYDSFTAYAIIFWGQNEASIIKISSFTGCGLEVTQNCISNKVTNLEGEDQQGRDWEVCSNNYCF
jgi:hypothetical protein